MHEYDVSLKLLLRSSGGAVLRALTGGADVAKWLDVEMPKVQNTRVDLLGETTAGDLIHIELQSTNDALMPVRMLEYWVRVYRLFGRAPRQVVLYVGAAPMRMGRELASGGLVFGYEMIDVRELDGERLLESSESGDNVIAILAAFRNQRGAVRRILGKIAELDARGRDLAFAQLLIVAGLRGLEEFVEREADSMPILDDIMDHKVIGRERKRGRREATLEILRMLIERRFGAVPSWAEERLNELEPAELLAVTIGVLDAQSLEDLLK